MTGEPAHTTSKVIRATELLFLSEYVPQLSITDLKINDHYVLLLVMISPLHNATYEEQ